MNICIYSHEEALRHWGGINTMTYTLKSLFEQHGHTVTLLAHKHEERTIQQEDADKDDKFFFPSEHINDDENKAFFIDYIRSQNIDVIIYQYLPYFSHCLPFFKKMLSRSEKKYKVITCFHQSSITQLKHKVFQYEPTIRKYRLGFLMPLLKSNFVLKIIAKLCVMAYRKTSRAVVDNSDYVVLLAKDYVSELCDVCGWKSLEKARVIQNCIPSVPIVDADIVSKKEKTVVWVANFFNFKRPDYALKIWKQVEKKHRDWKLQMLGNGKLFDSMRQYASRLGLKNIDFVGRVNPKEYYEKASIIIQTSAFEAYPMVLIEAMNEYVVPVVFDSYPAAKEIIEDGISGILAKPFQVQSMAVALNEIMDDNNRLQVMQKAAFLKSHISYPDACYEKWSVLLNECIYER